MGARNCDMCGVAYEQRSSQHRFCGDTCRQRARRAGLGRGETPDGPVVRTHRAELESLGLGDSSEGAIVLALAGILDAQKGAVGAAATADRLDRLMDRLRKRRPSVATPLDELRERRKRRGA